MKYALRMEPGAERQLAGHPEPLQSFIRECLQRLAESPSAYRPHGGDAHRGQLAEFRYDKEVGVSVWITVRFLFGADEQTLHIARIDVEFGA